MSLPHFSLPLASDGMMLPAFSELSHMPIWLAWRVGKAKAGGGFQKPPVPCRRDGKPNDALDATNWNQSANLVTLNEAVGFAEKHKLAGVGILPQAGSGFVFGDLDHAYVGGVATDWARGIVNHDGEVESYTEKSPSGNGLRFIGRGTGNLQNAAQGVELFDGTKPQFLTITGAKLRSAPNDIRLAPRTLAACLARAGVPAAKVAAPVAEQGELERAGQGGVDWQPEASPMRRMNDAALGDLDRWVPEVFPTAERAAGGGWRVAAGDLPGHEGLTEAMSITARGIVDFGLADMGDLRLGKRTPIDLLMAPYGGCATPIEAARKLAAILELDDPFPATEAGSLLAGSEPAIAYPLWPDGVLPTEVQAYAQNVAATCGGDAPAASALLLAALCAAAPSRVTFEPRSGWTVPVNIYAAIVGYSGAAKSPLVGAATGPLQDMDVQARIKRANAPKGGKADATEAFAAPGATSQSGAYLQRVVTGATVEGVRRLAQRTGDSVIYVADELQMLFGSFDKYSGKSSTGSTDRASWLSGFDGKADATVRADESKETFIERLVVSIIGGIQPGVIAPILAALASDGLLQRFLLCPVPGRRKALRIERDTFNAEVYATSTRLIANCGAQGLILRASPEAVDVSHELEAWALTEAGKRDERDALAGVLSKAHGTMARLAAGLHLTEWAAGVAVDIALGMRTEANCGEPGGCVSGATAEKAARAFREYFWPAILVTHEIALREMVGMSGARKGNDASVLRLWVEGLPMVRGAQSFTRRDARQVLNFAKSDDRWDKAIDHLVVEKRLTSLPGKNGKGERWQVSGGGQT